ncbi:hypothetical protein FSP39_016832 [Pinctada imbricata]|uniref:C1q domain-containing protein n=1 Tax=Pinctada imbricata TaxID=66713 RepID=A0AA88YNV9_PINIB|nr:hypothetical protein FSP39_016832 [Pinctada imbricata]
MSHSDSQSCYAYIYHNGNSLLLSNSHEAKGGSNEAASNTIVLSLIAGDRVWIKTDRGAYCYGYPLTGFSGWKI